VSSSNNNKPVTLFDHVNALNYGKSRDYFSKLSEKDKKTWSSFMVTKFLSMDKDNVLWCDIAGTFQQQLDNERYYKLLTILLPRAPKKLQWLGEKKSDKSQDKSLYDKHIVAIQRAYGGITVREAKEYYSLLTKEQKDYIFETYTFE
jgi:hypothetical protein